MDTDRAPRTVAELRQRIAEVEAGLPPRLRDCAAYVLAQPDRVPFDTVADAATAAGVQPSAFIRFAKALGLSGFTEMQRLFRADAAAPRPDYQSRLAALRAHGDGSPEQLLADFSLAASGAIEAVAAGVDRADLARAVALISTAPVLHVVGLRRSFAVASHITYLLRRIGRPTILHDGVGGLDAAGLMGAGHVLIAVSFAPFAPETVALAETARERGAFVVAITEPGLSPLRSVGDVVFEVREAEVGGIRSFAATLCLATTLCVAAGARRAGERAAT